MGPFERNWFAIGIGSQDLFHGCVMFFVFGRRARNAEFIQNIFDEAELLKMNFMAMFSLHVFNVDSQEVFDVAFVFQKKFIRQSGNEVIDDFVVFGKDTAVIGVEANDCIISNEQTWVCVAGDKTFCLEAL